MENVKFGKKRKKLYEWPVPSPSAGLSFSPGRSQTHKTLLMGVCVSQENMLRNTALGSSRTLP